jgi:cation diffusion facilitator CzcD-associated flavoprotein CzcO
MCYSDRPFDESGGGKPYVHHSVVQRYLEDYYAHNTGEDEKNLVLGVTVEDVSKIDESWRLVLRKRLNDDQDYWWEEVFDAVVVAIGHYHVPMVCVFLFL